MQRSAWQEQLDVSCCAVLCVGPAMAVLFFLAACSSIQRMLIPRKMLTLVAWSIISSGRCSIPVVTCTAWKFGFQVQWQLVVYMTGTKSCIDAPG
jgi:hypothetical protein